MSSGAVRDPVADHLVTPQNAALVVIDYQPSQVAAIRSMDPDLLLENIVSTVKTAKAFGLPIVHSTVNVASGRGQPTVPELAELLEDSPLSGDDGEAKSEVTALFENAGFVAIDLGGLVTGGAMQQLSGPLAGVNLIQLPYAT
jgi:nicotinamidase-related amidase